MKNLVILSRALQLLAHNGHSVTTPAALFLDHAFLGELSATYQAVYDSLVERMLGLGGGLDLIELQGAAVTTLARRSAQTAQDEIDRAALSRPSGSPARPFYRALLDGERDGCVYIEALMAAAKNDSSRWTQSTRELLGTLADESEVRQFKLERRLAL
jgi:hypothetical protein